MLENFNPNILNINPLIAVVDDFLSASECDALITLAQGRLRRATVHNANSDGAVSQNRTNAHCSAPPGEFPQVIPLLMKLGMLLRIPMHHAEGPMLLHYTQAQEFKPHADGIMLDSNPERIERFQRAGGQRLFSTLAYLNDVEEGGGTGFPELGVSVAPKQGRLLIFANTMAGSRDMANLSIHAGEPVTAGEKWAAIAWWRENPVSEG
ncbi:MAG: 2OG-Fe(II) oxygenase [Pseudomonadota bacterium]